MQRFLAVVGVTLFLMAAVPVLAQTQMPESVVSGGGVDMGGGSYIMRCTVGQGPIGRIAGPSYQMEIGFWQGHYAYVTPVSLLPEFIWEMQQNSPNPFNPRTTISYSLPEATHVSLRVYNVRGELVRTLVEEEVAAGDHVAVWNGRNNQGSGVSSGVYLARLISQEGVLTRKMVLAR